MRKWIFLIVLLACVGLSVTSRADEASENPQQNAILSISPEAIATLLPSSGAAILEYQADDYRAEGKIEGCGVSFQYLFRDWAYRDNAPTVGYGSVVYFWEPGQAPYLGLRLGINDLTVAHNTVSKEFGKPNFAYIQINGKSMAGREYKVLRFQDDHIISVIYLDDTKMALFTEMLVLEKLTVSFNREKGATDLSYELSSDHNNGENPKVSLCLIEMAKRVSQESKP